MTHQASNARKLAKARDITKLHKNGEKGPARTTPLHGKRWTYRNNPEVQKRMQEAVKAMNAQKQGKTLLEVLNEEKAAEASRKTGGKKQVRVNTANTTHVGE